MNDQEDLSELEAFIAKLVKEETPEEPMPVLDSKALIEKIDEDLATLTPPAPMKRQSGRLFNTKPVVYDEMTTSSASSQSSFEGDDHKKKARLEKLLAWKKNNHDKLHEVVTCPWCGGRYQYRHKARHAKSRKHLKACHRVWV